ncbi:head maturation protease, ClpP-related [Lactobacillus crispatus]|uniref:head maturation protease, ClpP-related n=1 Tax=Lactobacillus crispatus TaxID=47770 RepID=UPI001F094722|nr:head maturation protease, ClpP-related [Lactobacillus crispatus]
MIMETLEVKGIIVPNDLSDVYDWMGYDSVSPSSIRDALNQASGQDIVVEINSRGGCVDAGSEIYTELKKYQGNIDIQIVGYACSAASWIALAGDTVEMSPTAQLMIHRASGGADGNVDDLASAMQGLDQMDQALVDLYAKRTGKSAQEVYQLMAKESWMNAKTAVANGFVDSIMFEDEQMPAVVNADGVPILSNQVINKIKNLIKEPKLQNKNKPKRQVKNENLSLLLWS